MEMYLLYFIAAMSLFSGIAIVIFNLLRAKNQATEVLLKPVMEIQNQLSSLAASVDRLEKNIKEDFRVNREEASVIAKSGREEITTNQKLFITEQITSFAGLEKRQRELSDKIFLDLDRQFRQFQEAFDKNVASFNSLQREKFAQLDIKQSELIKSTETKLEFIRVTVEEKLEKTLSDRLGQSFETVGKQLIEVQKGLGEMQTLAQDVGGLKKVLSNVKMRGGIGEVQLAMLLEQILAPEQYQANVKTKSDSSDLVEFAIKLPGRGEGHGPVWLPIDAKFPKDVYETLLDAYDKGEVAGIEQAQKALDNTIKKMAKDISEKYIDPPNTTDFGIMFLPFEGIFAEVVRKAALLEDLQRNYKIIVTGPTTIAAILNSLQMGFKTLAIEKRSSEVWQVLGAVKKEFESFGSLMKKAQSNIQTGLNQLDDVMGVRTRAIERRLKGVESLSDTDSLRILGTTNRPDLEMTED